MTRWVLYESTGSAYWSTNNDWNTDFDKAQSFDYSEAEALLESYKKAPEESPLYTPGTIEILQRSN